MNSCFRLIATTLVTLALTGNLRAHAGFENQTEVRIYQNRMEMVVRTSFALAWKILGERAPATADDAGRAIARRLLVEEASDLFEVTAGGVALVPKAADSVFELNSDVAFKLTYERPAVWPLVLRAQFFRLLGPLDSGSISVFDQTLVPYQHDTDPVAGKVIHASDPLFSFTPAPVVVAATPAVLSVGEPPPFGRYFLLGIHHILLGYDHLLFLLALLLGCRSLKAMLFIVTAFTVAHSITLALAAFDVLNLPTRWVESFIALSIVYVGVENIGWKVVDTRRGLLTFAFGLVHGLGFAGVLKGIGLGAGGHSILPPLLAFNLGVETGQLAIVILILPMLLYLRKTTWFARFGSLGLSALVIAAGVVWFCQRAFA